MATLSARASIIRTLCCTAVAGAIGVGALQAQEAGRGSAPSPPQVQAPRPGRGQMGMMAEHQKMMAAMAASQKKLDGLVATMNSATGHSKIDQMAAVINEMVAQHKAMAGRMMSMHGDMMKQMAQPAEPGSATPAAQPPAETGAPAAGHDQHRE